MKYLGIDWGEKRIGLALGDSEIKIATPFKTAENADDVLKLILDEEVDIIIIGKPYQISNIQYPLSNKFNNFLSELKSKIKIPVELIDERLSSKAADALPGDKKTKASRDEIAAMLILQSWLDKI
ncbi:MAG: Holliday junction resolvase RuvX [bacterium]|nr:Holliday junction resolvase RuvX [bacterium]